MKEKLMELCKNSYAPYSNFRVSCIVKTKDGKEFKGVNVENASYGASICAERNAILNAVTNGYKYGDFDSMFVYVDSDKIGTCCFNCRQVMIEFFESDKVVHFYSHIEEMDLTINDLCPVPFTKDNL